MKVIFVFLLLLVAFPLFAAEYSFRQLLDIMVVSNYEIKQMESEVRSTEKLIPIKSSLKDTKLKYSLMDISSKTLLDSEMLRHNISLEQEFPLSDKLASEKNIATLDYKDTVLQLALKKAELKKMLLSMLMDYYVVAQTERNRASKLVLLKQLSETAKAKYAVGKAEFANVVAVDLEIAGAMNMLIELSNRRATLKNEIVDLLDIEDDALEIKLPVISASNYNLAKLDAESLYTAFLNYYPEVFMRTNRIEKMNQLVKIAEADFVPDLMVGLTYSLKPNPETEHLFSLEVGFNLPLFSFGQKSAMGEMNKEQKKAAEYANDRFKNDFRNAIKRLVIEAKGMDASLKLFSASSIQLGEVNLKTLLTSYLNDKADFGMLFDSIGTLYDLYQSYYEYVGNVMKSLVEIEYMTGEKFYNFSN